MPIIELPKKIEFKAEDERNRGLVVVEPCHPGYGITIGNSLRRVLLSSLPGASVIGVKIKGATHEFMTLPHIQEDVLEIILNLKMLRLKVHSDEPVRLEVDAHGEKSVTGGDIKSNSDVEIMNPELKIATITDMAGKLEMEIFVSQGKGYETIESREHKSNEIGYIEIDSLFSPVINVGINIENVRVGKMTNWEKLTLDILTDGTINPMQAFERASQILVEQFKSLVISAPEDEAEEIIKATEESEEEIIDESDDIEGEKEDEPKKKRGRPKKS